MKIYSSIVLSFCLLLLVVTSAQAQTVSAQKFETKAVRGVDEITVLHEGERTIFLITSKGGIGAATIKRLAKQWPDVAVVRLRYSPEKGFGNLEGFDMKTSAVRVATGLGGAARVPVQNANPHAEVEMPVTKKDGYIEVSLPMSLLKDDTEFLVSWVDAYR